MSNWRNFETYLRFCTCLRIGRREQELEHLTNAQDEKALAAVRTFNPYDLYSKSDERVIPEELKPHYQELIKKYCPKVVEWRRDRNLEGWLESNSIGLLRQKDCGNI